uniref:Uncharacterized protein n=1 Tax=Timema monikensis TaxID=170555 RepID=A0A7R9E7W4_9NEOP|nr:unnamed protein product [Timema monikensis]
MYSSYIITKQDRVVVVAALCGMLQTDFIHKSGPCFEAIPSLSDVCTDVRQKTKDFKTSCHFKMSEENTSASKETFVSGTEETPLKLTNTFKNSRSSDQKL